MIKVCHITSAHDTSDIRIFQKECVSLAKKGYETYLVGEGNSITKNGVNVIGVGEKTGNRLFRMFFFARKVVKVALKTNSKIYHFHDPEILLYAKKLKKNNAIVIFDSHELYREQILNKPYIPRKLRRIVAYFYETIENRALKYIDAVIYPSAGNVQHPYEGKNVKCAFINNTPIINNLNNFDVENAHNKGDTVCCVGTLVKERGVDVLIEACYKAKVKLILAGNIMPENFKNELMQRKEFSIVDYRGYCNREEVEQIYREAFIGVDNIQRVGQYPQISNLSTKVYEYMSRGIPFIVSNFEYNEYIVQKYKCGICIDPSDSDEIAEAILYLLKDKENAILMGKRGRKLIEDKFNWEIDAKKLQDLYQELLKEESNENIDIR